MKGILVILLIYALFHYGNASPNEITYDELDYWWPSLISTPMSNLLGDECYFSLLEEFHITDIPCLKLAISKGLGVGIVVGGAIVKVPQIITIMKHRSAKGISLASFLLETCAYEIVLVYNTRLHNPFSTYGEVLFMTSQNILISVLIVYYNGEKRLIGPLLAGFGGGYLILKIVPSWLMSVLYAAQIPIGLASKIPQIRANYKNRSTGQLSVFAVLNYFIGTAARAFTTWTELDDPIMLGGNLLASLLNGILVLQVYMYWGNKPLQHLPTSLPPTTKAD
jgi:mannose-P-dolichol utilization defect protein 1